MPKLIKYLLIISLVVVEGYLAVSLVVGDANKKKEIETSCDQKCNYSQNSYMWEFNGENVARGFTTKDECNNYCIRYEQGFVYSSALDAKNFLGSLIRR